MSFKSMVKGHELAYVTKILAIFGAVEERQMQQLFSFLSDSEYGRIMTRLAREGQFYRTPDARYLTFSRLRFEKLNVSSSVDCFWAFLELKDRVQDFCAGEPPAIITMSAQTTDHDLIPVSGENTMQINENAEELPERTVRFVLDIIHAKHPRITVFPQKPLILAAFIILHFGLFLNIFSQNISDYFEIIRPEKTFECFSVDPTYDRQ